MEKSRLINTTLNIQYEPTHIKSEECAKEFNKLTQSDEDPIGEWLRIMRAKKGNFDSENTIVLELLVEIYRKLEILENKIEKNPKTYIPLQYSSNISTIGHGCFMLQDSNLLENILYYGRVELPTFPTRIVPMYFKYSNQLAFIEQIHARDEAEWDSYVASKERALIRMIKSDKKANI